jgi:hypothetical protein
MDDPGGDPAKVAAETAPEAEAALDADDGEPEGQTLTSSSCPFCLSSVSDGATKCPHCAANIGDIRLCPSCAEPVRETATICPFCRGDLLPPAFEEARALLADPWVIESSPLGGLITDQSVTALFYPPIMTITATEIRIRRRQFMGLRTMDSKISVGRIASVRVLDGVVWGGLVIETYGGAAGDLAIGGLDKDEARQTAQLIERIAEVTPSKKSDRS